MKQAVLVGAKRSAIEEAPSPALAPDGVLVKVMASGICASELHVWETGASAPLRLGHEVAGKVVAVGPSVTRFAPGDRVTGLFHQGFSDFAAASEDRVLPIPEGLGYEAAFGEPLACAVSGALRTKVELGDRLAIVGLGFMGLLMLQLLRLKGPAEILGIDLRGDARARGLALGCDRVLARTDVTAPEKQNFDVVVEATGTPDGLELAGRLCRQHGVLSILGYHQGGPRSVDMQDWNFKALEVLNAHERRPAARMDAMRRGLALAASGRIDLATLPTHRFPLTQVDEAFAALAGKPDGFAKAVIVADPLS
jgi:threonine dehydrogenase-like Zn-dependent dehydrogenase